MCRVDPALHVRLLAVLCNDVVEGAGLRQEISTRADDQMQLHTDRQHALNQVRLLHCICSGDTICGSEKLPKYRQGVCQRDTVLLLREQLCTPWPSLNNSHMSSSSTHSTNHMKLPSTVAARQLVHLTTLDDCFPDVAAADLQGPSQVCIGLSTMQHVWAACRCAVSQPPCR